MLGGIQLIIEIRIEDRVTKKYCTFREAANAANLSMEKASMLIELDKVYRETRENNEKRLRYYLDKVSPKNLGESLPARFRRISVNIGWAEIAVDHIAARSILMGVNAPEGIDDAVQTIVEQNDLTMRYSMALPMDLVHGTGFWTVSPGREDEPEVVVNFHDAESAFAVWDYRKGRVKYGAVIEDWTTVEDEMRPSCIVLHTDKDITEVTYVNGKWVAETRKHQVGRCLMESMSYRASTKRPFGKSRVSPTVMSLTDDMQRAIVNLALHDEIHANPLKFLLGISPKQYDEMMLEKMRWYHTSLLLAEATPSGTKPEAGMINASSPEGHIAYVNKLAARAAAATGLPVSAFGVVDNGYQSSEALRANSDDAIIEAEAINRDNGRALKRVMQLALAVMESTTFADISSGDGGKISVRFADPAMTTDSAISDAMAKQSGFLGDGFASSDVCLEKLGYTEDEIRRIKANQQSAQTRAAMNAIFGGNADAAS